MKTVFLNNISVLIALEVFYDNALYKLTFYLLSYLLTLAAISLDQCFRATSMSITDNWLIIKDGSSELLRLPWLNRSPYLPTLACSVQESIYHCRNNLSRYRCLFDLIYDQLSVRVYCNILLLDLYTQACLNLCAL